MLHHKDLSGLDGQEHLHLPLDVQPQCRIRVNHDYPMRFVLSELRGHCPGLAGLSSAEACQGTACLACGIVCPSPLLQQVVQRWSLQQGILTLQCRSAEFVRR